MSSMGVRCRYIGFLHILEVGYTSAGFVSNQNYVKIQHSPRDLRKEKTLLSIFLIRWFIKSERTKRFGGRTWMEENRN